MTNEQLLKDLARAKALFQQRAILAAMGVRPEQARAPVEPERTTDNG